MEERNTDITKFKDKDVQTALVNRILLTVVIVLTAVLLAGMLISSHGTYIYAYMVTCLITWGGGIYLNSRSRSAQISRYFIFIMVFIAYSIVLMPANMIYSNTYIFPIMIIGILYFDKRYCLMQAVLAALINIIKLIYDMALGKTLSLENYTAMMLAVAFAIVTYVMFNLADRFQSASMEAIRNEEHAQKEILKDVMQIADHVQKGTSQAGTLVNDLKDSTQTVNSAVEEITAGTRNTAENIQEQTSMTNNLQNAITDTVERSDEIVKVAEDSMKTVDTALARVTELKQQAESINRTNGTVMSTMEQLQDKMKEMEGIIATISSISKQTNLLSLNASIESARAGEAGKGFAVVSGQIRTLAEETKNSTEDIRVIIDDLSAKANDAADTVRSSLESVGRQNELIESTSQDFHEISKSFSNLSDGIREISSMISKLEEVNRTFVDNISQLSATSQETTANSEQAAEISARNLENANTVRKLLQDILDTAGALEKYSR